MSAQAKIIPIPRAWDAGQVTDLLASWVKAPRPVDYDLRTGLKMIRARSREVAQNADHAKAFLRLLKTNVIGRKGILLQAKNLQRNGKPAQRLNNTIEQWWRKWNQKGACDVTGRYSGLDVQRLAIETVAKDGECIVRIMEGWGNRHAFAVQFIDAEALDIDYNADLPNGNVVRMGVELDVWRRPVRYYLRDEPGPTRASYQQMERVAVPASEILHVYLPEWIWQTRGIPWMATGLSRLKMLTGYEEAAVTAARSGASKMGFFSQDIETQPPGYQPPLIKREDGTLLEALEAGQTEILPPGVTFQGWDPAYPNIDHGVFVKDCLRSIASGWGVIYNSLSGDLEGVNYSSLRTGALSERDVWMTLQEWFMEAFLQPIFDRWLYVQLELGRLTDFAGQAFTPDRFDALNSVKWQPRRWPWVDPLKDMQANSAAVALRTRSISSIIREQGEDPDEVWEEMKADNERLKEMGLTIAAAPAAEQQPPQQAQQTPAQEPAEEPEDADEA